MESMEKPAVGTERYIKPQMEIIELGNDIIVTSGCDDDFCDDDHPTTYNGLGEEE